jgi:pyruvate dehydrogenase E2 component (dihydrolipoamide acetyltransferase)
MTDVKVPDIGDFKDIPIIEIHVKAGDVVNVEDPLLTLESDKATMDVPAPNGGTVEAVLVEVGDRVSEGTSVFRFRANEAGAMSQPLSLLPQQEQPPAPQPTPSPAGPAAAAPQQATPQQSAPALPDFSVVHAGPGVRRAARELGVDLTKVKGTGEKGRITKEDVLGFLRRPAASAAPAGSGIPEIPAQDFSKFGPV